MLRDHWAALQRKEWRAAYDRLHPQLKSAITLKKFAELHSARRKKSGAFPQEIKISGSALAGTDVVVSFDALIVPPGGSEAVAIPPRRRVTLRQSGGSWGLMTHDVLAVMP